MKPCLGCDAPCEPLSVEATCMESGEATVFRPYVCAKCAPLLGYLLLTVPEDSP